MKISGNIIDIHNKKIFKGEIEIIGNVIHRITEKDHVDNQYILPGFIDAHVHIESSMIIPSEFARMAVVHGTVATVSDPHEIGNVLGIKGVKYMIENGKQVSFKFYFGAPSCVPATAFETAGATIDEDDVDELLKLEDVRYLAEMMNWPGVLHEDPIVKKKISIAQKYNKVVDGHAPGLKGDQAKRYAAAGISTDHECFTAEEALDKLAYGMKIIIREGSAAKNFDALVDLLNDHSDRMMFCSDDKHPDSLEEGHINVLVKRALAKGVDLFKVLRVACINPIEHYGLKVGELRQGDAADFIIVNNVKDFGVLKTYINGELVAEGGKSKIKSVKAQIVNNFSAEPITHKSLEIKAAANSMLRVIEALDGQLITNELLMSPKVVGGNVVSDAENDVLKIVVINRYSKSPPAVGFIKNFNLKKGAIASSVAHDSHNIIAVGVDDDSIARAVNLIIRHKGGVSAVNENEFIVPLPVAGIMSAEDGYLISKRYKEIDAMAKTMGSTLQSPFMTLSFMALLVIPSLKLSDKGLFNGERFEFADVVVKQ